MREWKFQEVREAVVGFIGDFPADTSYIEVVRAYEDVMRRMSLDLTGQNVGGYWREPTAQRDKLWNQVRRALDELCGSQGKLVKVGRGMHHPSGAYESATAYYPMANYERADAAAKESFRARDELAAAWVDVHSRLEDLGFAVYSTKGQPVALDLDSWQRMLAMAETGEYVEPGSDPLA